MAHVTAVRRAHHASSTTNSTTYAPSGAQFNWNLDTAISSGERVLWVLIVSSDGNPTLSETVGGWTKEGQASNGTTATGALFTQETTAAYAASAHPSFSISSTASEQYSCALLAFKVASGKSVGKLTAASANGSSTNSNPASITNSSGASQDVTVIASRSGDSTTVATVAPTNYGNLQTQAGGGTGGASTNTAERQITIANSGTEDPGTFTSALEQWVCWTLGIYEFTAPNPPGRADETDTAYSRGIVLPVARANETETAFALAPVLVLTRQAVQRVNFLQGQFTTDAGGNLSLSLSGLTLQQNDVLVAIVASGSVTTDRDIAASGNNSGALAEQADLYANDTLDTNLYVGLARQTATPDTSISVTGFAGLQEGVYQILQYRAVNTSVAADVAATTATGIDTDAADPPSITPTTAGAKIVAIYAAAQSSAQVWSAPSGLANFIQQADALPRGRAASGDANWTSGAFDPAVASPLNGSLSNSWAAVTIALRPAPDETDTAFALGMKVVLATGMATEVDTAFSFPTATQISVGRADEVNTARQPGLGHAANRSNETDTAQTRGVGIAASRANETDTAFALLNLSIGRAEEVDSAFALGQGRTYGVSTESDVAFARGQVQIRPVGIALETDVAYTRSANLGASRSNETDTAFALGKVFIRATGLATETDIPVVRPPLVLRATGFTSETDAAFNLGFARVVGQANETDLAFSRGVISSLPLGLAVEFDQAFNLFGALVAGTARKPYVKQQRGLRERRQSVYGGSRFN